MSDDFTEAMGQLAGGVAVVCVRDGRDDIGTTVTSFTSVSLDPPLVLACLATESYMSEILGGRWAATLLSAGQTTLASRFASPGRPSARLLLAGVPHHRGRYSDAFIVDGGVAAVECETVRQFEAGDHTLFIAQVHAVDYATPTAKPLIRLRGRYRAFEH
ncbi:flavin reductase family protein [Rhizohabitans arisaemae]|uniref:flavin reductase family protein n=1 Tax=Rhizohabitans arisaemae TaxID=2720610 RepID=UPI0024B28247|nr:flavin reductase family protein [Rhizohabitans arisaemae]